MRRLHTSRLTAQAAMGRSSDCIVCVKTCQHNKSQNKFKKQKQDSNEGDNSFCVAELLGQPTSHVH